MTTNKTCHVYVRVSTEDQAKGFSPKSQKSACIDYAKSQGYKVLNVFIEDGKSARTTQRPEFQKMLNDIKSKPVDAVVFYKVDRFARNVIDFANIRKEFKKHGN